MPKLVNCDSRGFAVSVAALCFIGEPGDAVETASAGYGQSADGLVYPNAGRFGGRFAILGLRALVALFLVSFQALLPQGRLSAASPPARVQAKGTVGSYTSSLSVTFTHPTTSGNQLVVALVDYYANDGVPFAISDSRGNLWKTAVDYVDGGHIIVLYAENIAGSSNETVTVTASSPTYFGMTAVEYTGLASANSLDVVARNRATGANYTSTPVTLATGNELLFGVHHIFGSGITFTPTSPWSTVSTQINYDEMQVQDLSVVSAGAYASTGTESSSNDTASVVVAFRGAWTGGAPVIPSFTASPSSIVSGNSSTLSWITAGATTVSIAPGIGDVAPSGSATVTPSATTVYTLTATNASGTVTAQATVTVNASPPVISSFTASPSSIVGGNSSTLLWSTTGATTVSIAPGVGSVALSGSATVTPSATTIYTLTATKASGTVTAQATVTVNASPPVI